MARFGLIIGSGELPWSSPWRALAHATTPYGEPSAPLNTSRCADHEIIALARHGVPHRIAPHAINYRANLRALADHNVVAVVALNTVGGISTRAQAGRLLIPDQLIDYTSGRAQSFHTDDDVHHIDFSEPYDATLCGALLTAGTQLGLNPVAGGTMGVTQGPRLETAAEITRMARDGCAVVGMTGMPEAVLARELGLPFACISLVVNPAAGVASGAIDLGAIAGVSKRAMADAVRLLERFFETAESVE